MLPVPTRRTLSLDLLALDRPHALTLLRLRESKQTRSSSSSSSKFVIASVALASKAAMVATIARVSVSALVASLPLLYVSLLRPPPAALAGDTAFWFLMSNCVIAAIIATAADDDRPRDDDRSNDGHVSLVQPPVVPLADKVEPPAVTLNGAGGVVVQEEVAAVATCSSNPMDQLVAPHFLVEAQSAGAANKPSHLRVQRGERHETTAAIEQSTDDHDGDSTAAVTVTAKGHEEGEDILNSSTPPPPPPPAAPGEAIPVGKPAAIVKALTTEPEAAEPEPWAAVPSNLVTSKSLPEEEEAADEEWWPVDSRPPDVLAHGKGRRLRRSATGGSTAPSVAEESEYWKLSDEELNRRVEDFIARFNRQIEQEAGV